MNDWVSAHDRSTPKAKGADYSGTAITHTAAPRHQVGLSDRARPLATTEPASSDATLFDQPVAAPDKPVTSPIPLVVLDSLADPVDQSDAMVREARHDLDELRYPALNFRVVAVHRYLACPAARKSLTDRAITPDTEVVR
jgi:hypothetical protein